MSISEDSLIKKIRSAAKAMPHERSRLRLGIGDDAALFSPTPGKETVASCDWFLEGVHFLQTKHPPEAVGWKSLARALSDLAAIGAAPRYFLLNLALPEKLAGTWLDDFLVGLGRAARRFRCTLAGGDTTRSERILIAITVMGEVASRRAIVRSGAKPGDIVCVSGTLGEAELGLKLLLSKKAGRKAAASAVRKHLYPEPRIALGQWLGRRNLATAMMDLSDGLSTDLIRLCASSGVGAQIASRLLPRPRLSPATAKNQRRAPELALHGGDDYELLFTVSPDNAKGLPKSVGGTAITPIGEVTRERGVYLLDQEGRRKRVPPKGWDPFR